MKEEITAQTVNNTNVWTG